MTSRFAFSMPQRRGPNDPWFRIGTLDVTTTVLVILACVVSMLVWAIEGARLFVGGPGLLVDGRIMGRLFLWPDAVRDGQVWRMVTWPLANWPDLWQVIMLAIFWYFGSEVERLLGRNRFAIWLLTVAVVPGLVATLLNLSQVGLRPIELAVFLLFVAEYPFARFFFGIPGWVIGAVILGIEILQLVGDRNEKGVLFLFVTLAVGALAARTMGLLANYPWVPALPIGSSGTGRRQRRSRSRNRPRRGGGGGDVVAGPWASSTRGGPTAPLPQPPPSAEAAADQAELDSLLDKISEKGMDGLTGAEKDRLNELSRRMRRRS